MKKFTLSLLAAAAIGAMSIGGASAMPFSSGQAALGESLVQDVRVVCDRSGRCYNTNRRAVRQHYGSRHYDRRGYNSRAYYDQPRHRGPSVGIGIGPVGVGVGIR